MTLNDHERALCIAALEQAAGDLMEGVDASKRLNYPIDLGFMSDTARQMRELREKLLTAA